MSDLCCKEVSIRIDDSCLVDCSTEDPIWVSGHVEANASAYAAPLCYYLTLRLSADLSETFFCQYNHSANTITDRASVVDYVISNVVYDAVERVFLCASASTVYVFHPQSNTVSNPLLTGATSALNFLYVPDKAKTYGQFQIGPNWFIGAIDLTANTITMIGGIAAPWSNMTYSPVADALYGTTGGNTLKKFSLISNVESSAAVVTADDCCWDSDNDKLICFGTVITEVDTFTDIATVRNNHSWAYTTSQYPVYVSTLHKCYVVGENSDSSAQIIYSYDTQTYVVQDVEHREATLNIGYYGVFIIEDTTLFAAAYDMDNPGTDGFRKVCVSGILDPYLYFKFDNDAVPSFQPPYRPVEERNGMPVMQSNDDTTATIDNVMGIIDNGCQLNSVPAVDTQSWSNQNMVGFVTPIWTNDIWNADFTIRIWVNVSPPDIGGFYPWVNMINSNADYTMSGGNLIFRWRFKPDGFPSYFASATASTPFGWHRVIFWYKKGVEIGIKIDNDPSVITAAPVLRAVEFPHFSVQGHSPNPQVDEFAIFKGVVLSEPEMLLDWNSGRGATWSPETSWVYPD